jgi:hypothetical protein
MTKIMAMVLAIALAGCAATPPEASKRGTPGASIASADNENSASAPGASSTNAPRMETPPTYKKGYKLTFRSRTSTYDMTYEGVRDGLLVFHFDTRERLPYDYLYTPDMKVAEISDAQQQSRFDPPVGYVDFPLYVGKKWEINYKATSNSMHSMAETSIEVMDYGPVQVPYGTVNAFRIKIRNSNREVSRNNPYETYWYSPEIGYFVKHETNKPVYEDPYELIAVSK